MDLEEMKSQIIELGYDQNKEYALTNLKLLCNQCVKEIERLITFEKMCKAIVKYNKNRNPDREQFYVRHDMFVRIQQALKAKE